MYYGNVTYLNPLELAQPGTTDSFFFFFFPERIHTAFLPYHSQLGWLAKEKTGAHKQLHMSSKTMMPRSVRASVHRPAQSAGSTAICCKWTECQPNAAQTQLTEQNYLQFSGMGDHTENY